MTLNPRRALDILASGLRVGAEIVGIPPRKANPMLPNEAQSAAEAKRQRKMAKRLTNAK